MLNTFDIVTTSWWILGFIYLVDFTVRLWLLAYIPKNRKPTAATAWLLLIFIVPLYGTILFFIIGNTKLSKVRLRDQKYITRLFKKYTAHLREAGLIATIDTSHEGAAKLAESLTGLAPTRGNAIKIMSGYDAIIHHMTAKVKTASQYIYVEFFALALDETTEPFFAALEAAQRRGVTVYVLFDYFGSKKYPRYKEMKERLSAQSIKWHVMLPIRLRPSKYNRPDLRNHRKIVIIDNTDAYTGSLNMIDKTYHRKDDISYIELVAHLQGPSVNELAAVFASDWYSESREALGHFMENSALSTKGSQVAQIIPSGPGYPYENNLKYFVTLIQNAQRSIVITNPYLVPDESLLNALISAALRGVTVSVLNSEAMDQWMVGHAQRSYYEQLLRAGVRISLYKKPQLVHEKYASIDGTIAIIGSSNLDRRSFELNHECTIALYDDAVAKKLAAHHTEFLMRSTPIQLKTWLKRSAWQSFLDSVARLTSALQ